MKKIMVALIMACTFLLTACGGDNGELAGTFKGSNGIMPEKWLVEYNKKDDSYIVTVFFDGMSDGKYSKAFVKHLKRNGEYLDESKNDHWAQVVNKDTIKTSSIKVKRVE
ncbi:hypothetical protein ZG96_004446 [Salmonella enterica subsp. enterica serovar Java]|nr:hypothetical protein [Salmonella enterica subsp. enterica serovar Java]EJC3483653.1 hypothetical protein [Salmonella enterica]